MAIDTPKNNTAVGPRALSQEGLDEFRRSFDGDPAKRLVQNVVTQHDVNDVALSRSIVTDSPHSFSIMLDDWSVTNQSKTGRCWMFAGLNVCRAETRNVLTSKTHITRTNSPTTSRATALRVRRDRRSSSFVSNIRMESRCVCTGPLRPSARCAQPSESVRGPKRLGEAWR